MVRSIRAGLKAKHSEICIKGRKGEKADICSLALAGAHTKYGFTLPLGHTSKFKSQSDTESQTEKKRNSYK